MLRVTARTEVIYGHYNDYVEACEELNRMLGEHGMKQWLVLDPVSGKQNIVVTSCDYDDFAEMKREQERFQSDAECMKVYRASAQWVVQGSSEREMLETATHLA